MGGSRSRFTARWGRVVGVAVLVLVGAAPLCADDAATSALARAWEAASRGDLETALRESEAAVGGEGQAASTYAWTVRAWVLSRAGQKAEALEAYDRAAALEPADALVQNNRGVVLLALGRLDEAAAAFRHALQLRPGYGDAQNNLGAALEKQGRQEEAQRAYREATEVDPQHATAHSNMGALALRQGRQEDARRAFRRAREIDPSLGAPVLNLLLVGASDFAVGEAYERLQAAANAPDAPVEVRARALAALAGRAAGGQRFEEARTYLLQAVELQPEDPALLNNLAVVEDQLGLDRDAMLHLEIALRLRPRSHVARNNVGIVHVHRGQWALAEDTFRAILAEDPEFHRAHYNLGVTLAAQGKLTEALGAFEAAAALAPRDGEVLYNLGLMRRRLGGSQAEEKAAYERALAIDPNLAEAHLSLGCLLADPQTRQDLRDEPQARRHLVRFLDLALPTDVEGRQQAEAWLAWLDERPGR